MELALIPHLIRKDLRHLWLLFALWLFLLLAQGTLIGSGFSSGDMIWQMVYMVFAIGIPLLQALVTIVLVPLLIQDESLVGTTAFWFTRPLSRQTVLAAKASFIAAFLVLPPLIIETLVFVVNGVSLHDILLALPEVIYGSFALIFPLAALATVTRTFARFALWLAAVWVVMTVCGVLIQFTRMALSPDALSAVAQDPSKMLSAALVSGLVSILGSFVVVLHQYLTRRTRLSIIGLIVTVAAAILMQVVWRYDFLKRPEVVASAAVFPPGSVGISLKTGSVFASDAFQFGFGKDPKTEVHVQAIFAQVPAGYQLKIEQAQTEITFPDGSVITSGQSKVPDLQMEWWPGALSQVIGDIPIVNATSKNNEVYAQLLTIDTPKYLEKKNLPGTLHATLSLNANKMDVIGRVPLRVGERIDDGSRHLQISQILHQTDAVRVIVRERKVNLWGTRSFDKFNFIGNDNGVYLLVNVSRHEAIVPDRNLNMDMTSAMIEGSTRLINRSIPIQFTGSKGDKQVVKLDDEWLAGAELMRIEAKPAGTLQRELTVPDFLMNPKR